MFGRMPKSTAKEEHGGSPLTEGKCSHTVEPRTVNVSMTDCAVMWRHLSAMCTREGFKTTENSSTHKPWRFVHWWKSDWSNSKSSTCSFDGAPSPSPPARESDWGQSGNRWHSRSRGHPGHSLPARLERSRSPEGREWRTSRAVDLTACHPSAADIGSIWGETQGEEGVKQAWAKASSNKYSA